MKTERAASASMLPITTESMITDSARRQPRFYYGWAIVAVVFVAQLLAIGSTSYAFSLFVRPLEQEFGLGRAEINNGLVAWLLGSALCSPLIGRLLDRCAVRWVMLAGSLLCTLGFVTIALLPSPWQMALGILLLIAPGTTALTSLPAATLVSRWFSRLRGRALGISAVATSMGGLVVVPLIRYVMENFGWRASLLVIGVLISVVMLPLIWWIVRDHPEDMGLAPDGIVAEPGSAVIMRTWNVSQLLRDRSFWLILLSAGPMFAIVQSQLAMLVPFASDKGVDLQRASLLISFLAIAGVIGKLVVGFIIDFHSKVGLLAGVAGVIIFSLLAFLLAPSYPGLVIGACLVGLALGGLLPIWGALVADFYGARSVGLAMGVLTTLQLPFCLLALRFVGEVPDRTGSYDLVCLVYLGVAAMAGAAALLLMKSPERC